MDDCLAPECDKEQRTRGNCHSHFSKIYKLMCAGKANEVDLIRRGLLYPNETGKPMKITPVDDNRKRKKRLPIKDTFYPFMTEVALAEEKTFLATYAPNVPTSNKQTSKKQDGPSQQDIFTLLLKAESPAERVALAYLLIARPTLTPQELIKMVTELQETFNG